MNLLKIILKTGSLDFPEGEIAYLEIAYFLPFANHRKPVRRCAEISITALKNNDETF